MDNRQGRVPPPVGANQRSAGSAAEINWNALGTPAAIVSAQPLAQGLSSDPEQAARDYLKANEKKVTEADAQNPDGWVNIGRARQLEGQTDAAIQVLQKALALKPGLARANYFYARVLKEEGKYDEAIAKLQSVLDNK